MADLLINGVDASEYGVMMGDGFVETLEAPLEMKELVTSSYRGEHGTRVVLADPKYAERSFSLTFTIKGSGLSLGARQASYLAARVWLFGQLHAVECDITVNDETYHLHYAGKSVSFGQNPQRTFANLTAKFYEYNPNNRGDSDSEEEDSDE